MKRFFKGLILVVLIGGFSSSLSLAKEGNKIGLIDTQKVMEEYWRAKLVRSEMSETEKFIKDAQLDDNKDLQKDLKEIEELQQKLKDGGLPRPKRVEIEELIKLRYNRLEAKRKLITKNLEGKINTFKFNRLNEDRKLIGEIKVAVAKFSAENGFDLVADRSAFLFSRAEFDVTSSIIAILNEGHEEENKEGAEEGEKAEEAEKAEKAEKAEDGGN